jgi:AraC-like DNA-binding protein
MLPAPNAISAKIVLGMFHLAVSLGVDERALRDAMRLESTEPSDCDDGIPVEAMRALFCEAERALGDELVGVHLAEKVSLGVFGFVYHSLHASDTVRDAYRRAVRHQALVSGPLRASFVEESDHAAIRIDVAAGLLLPVHAAEYIALVYLRSGRAASGASWSPRSVSFRHTDRPVAALAAIFGAPVQLGAPHNEIVLDQATLALPVPSADAAVAALLDHEANAALERAGRTSSASDRVRAAMREKLQDGEPGIDEIAAHLRASPRSLQRRLAREGTTFAAQLDLVRRDLALRHIAQRHVGIAEIAFLTGFSDASAFYRAFRRWTGTTPAEYRRQASSAART